MRRLGLFAILALTPLTVQAAAGDHDPTFIARINLHVVKIHAHSPNGTALGSGVFIGPGEVVTNCHVTRYADSIQVRKGGIWMHALSQQADLARDLCLLQVNRVPIPIAPLRSVTEVSRGDVVYAVGFAGGAGSVFAQGTIHGLHKFDGGCVIETTTGFNLGSSGGALFDQDGNLLGVTTFRARGSRDGHFYAVPADWIQELRRREPRDIGPLDAGAPFWAEERSRQPYFLQAVSLESEQDWATLYRVAEEWTKDDPTDPDAWYFRGRATAKLARPNEAVDDLAKAVQLNPGFSRAWFELGLLYAQLGRPEDLARVRVSLSRLDEDLDQELTGSLDGL